MVTPAKRGKGKKSKVSCEPQTPAERRACMTWAQRLKRVFHIDIETCPACGGQVRIIVCIEDPVVMPKALRGAGSQEDTRPRDGQDRSRGTQAVVREPGATWLV